MAQTGSRPVNVFVSYSHKDEKYMLELHEALSPLRRRNLIKEWYDGKIASGDEFGQEIFQHLSMSDIILLLLSPSYVSSDYCWDKEMKAAFDLHRRRDVRVVGIVVRPVHLHGLELSHHKLLPKSGKAVQLWHPKSQAWENVCAGIEQVIDDLSCPSQVDDALGVPRTVVAAASASQLRRAAGRARKVHDLKSVSEFWESRGSIVVPGRLVSLQGTFSQFAPMLLGAPKAKAHLHKAFRQALEREQTLRKQKGPSLDSCLSVSAGQMVWRFREGQSTHIYFGLYNSIVRNSIPVLVEKDYYFSRLDSLFQEYGRKTFEARVTGRVIELDNSPARQFLNKHARPFIPDEIVEDLCRDVYGIVVDGAGTGVDRQGDARYLDGDIWIAVESEGRERFLTSFLDVANPAERKEELDQLFRMALLLPGPPRIITQYDEELEFAHDLAPVSGKNEFLDSIWRFGFGS